MDEVLVNILKAIDECAISIIRTDSANVTKTCAEAVKELAGAYVLLSNNKEE